MKITGELLKSERIHKNLSIQDVAHALKLSSRIVQAIENGNVDELPAKTFVRGFVKSYADYLKMDSEIVLKQFHEEMGSTLPAVKNIVSNDSQQVQNKKTSVDFSAQAESISGKKYEDGLTKKNITYFAIVMVLIVAIVTINKVVSHYENEVVQTAENKVVSPTIQLAELSTPGSSTAASSTIQISAASESVPQVDKNQTSSSSLEPSAQVQIAASAATTAVQNNKANSQTTNDASSLKSPIEKSKGAPIEMLIEAKKDTTVEYAKGNTNTFKKLFIKANTYQIIKSSTGLHFRAEDGSVINVTVNGLNKGILSPTNKPIELTY